MLKKKIFVHLPYKELIENLVKIEAEDFNIELCLSSDIIDDYPSENIDIILQFLRETMKQCTLHAPYRDLNPGSFDSSVREVTLQRFYKTFELATQFEPEVIVFHSGFDPRRYLGLGNEWLQLSLESWEKIVQKAEGVTAQLAIENVFETHPHQILSIIKMFSPHLNFCLDVGHCNIFSQISLTDWFEQLNSYLVEIHLHDNNGEIDEHLAIGEGSFPFDELFSLIEEYKSSPLLTIEGRDEIAIRKSLAYLLSYINERSTD